MNKWMNEIIKRIKFRHQKGQNDGKNEVTKLQNDKLIIEWINEEINEAIEYMKVLY